MIMMNIITRSILPTIQMILWRRNKWTFQWRRKSKLSNIGKMDAMAGTKHWSKFNINTTKWIRLTRCETGKNYWRMVIIWINVTVVSFQSVNIFSFHSGFGGVREKRRQINQHVWDQFSAAKSETVYNEDLIRWAKEKAAELELNDFKASYEWLRTWKKKYEVENKDLATPLEDLYTDRETRSQSHCK